MNIIINVRFDAAKVQIYLESAKSSARNVEKKRN